MPSLSIEDILEELRRKFRSMENRVVHIEKEAEDNMQIFNNYRTDIEKLERVLDQIKEETELEKDKLVSSFSTTISIK